MKLYRAPDARSLSTHKVHRKMLHLSLLLIVLFASATASHADGTRDAVAEPQARVLQADTPLATMQGSRFQGPAGWSIHSEGSAVFLAPPEEGTRVALVDVAAPDADAAVAAAWAAFHPAKLWPLKLANDLPPRDGWEQIREYSYETSANDRLLVAARVFRRSSTWTVLVSEIPYAVAGKRGSQLALLQGHILPKGGQRESFAGRKANDLTPERVAALRRFLVNAQTQLDIPGVVLGLVQHGKTVFAGGMGVRDMDKPEPVDADTRFLVASNTKAMTTLMLATLVDEGKFDWETPVAQLWPEFQLGDADTTRKVRVKHLLCACTGLPRQDYEWLLQYGGVAPIDVVRGLAELQPTSEFGALYQYSNQLAAAGGYLGAHVLYPERELGVAYDEAMRTRVFAPLGMDATTFDFAIALEGNHATPYSQDVDGGLGKVDMRLNYSIDALRPAGGAWSNVHDLLRFVQFELDKGKLSDGTRYISEKALLTRREPQVKLGADGAYGMGLFIDRTSDITSVQHGGSMIGYQTGMLWFPDHDIGIVVLTNADNGGVLMPLVRRYLLELLFDGKPQAEAELASAAARLKARRVAERKRLTLPAEPGVVAKLASRYRDASLGDVVVRRGQSAVMVDFGEWGSEVATRRNDDGTVSLVTVAPGAVGYELVIADRNDQRRLVLRDAQHEYVFDEVSE